MNTTVAAVIAVMLLGGGGWYVYHSVQTTDEPARTAVEVRESEERDLSGSGTFESLLALGDSITCDIAYTDPETGTDADGTVFVAGDEMRADFTLTHEGEVFDSHMIKTDTTLYTWTDSSRGSYAVAVSVSEGEEVESDSAASEQPVKWDQNVTYECREWERDDAMFTPPADVDFMDPASMMQDMMRQYGISQ